MFATHKRAVQLQVNASMRGELPLEQWSTDMNSDPVVVQRVFDAPIAAVWTAITDPGEMRQWFFETMDTFEAVVGFETQFNVNCGDKDYLHLWKVVDVRPAQRIAYQWRYGGCSGDSVVIWELSTVGQRTALLLTHDVRESFPQDDPNFQRDSCKAGWEYFIHESLRAFLEERNA